MSYENRPPVTLPWVVDGDQGGTENVPPGSTLLVTGTLGIETTVVAGPILEVAFRGSELPPIATDTGIQLVVTTTTAPQGARMTICDALRDSMPPAVTQPATAELFWYDSATNGCGRSPYDFCALMTGSTTLVNINTINNPAFLVQDINTGLCHRANTTNVCLVNGPWTTQALARNPATGRMELVPVRERYELTRTIAPVNFAIAPVDTKVLIAFPQGGVQGTVVLNPPLLPCDPIDIHIKNGGTSLGGGGIRVLPGVGVASLDGLAFVDLADIGPKGGHGESLHFVWDAASLVYELI